MLPKINKYLSLIGVISIILSLAVFLTGCGIFNQPPTAKISTKPSPPKDFPPLTVEFDGSGSTDPENSIASYEWDFGDSDSGEDNTATGPKVSHTYETKGEFTVELTVTDDQGEQDTATVTVDTDLSPPSPP